MERTGRGLCVEVALEEGKSATAKDGAFLGEKNELTSRACVQRRFDVLRLDFGGEGEKGLIGSV